MGAGARRQGLGKTIQTIALICYLYEKKGVKGPHLIVAPKAVLSNWARELAEWAPTLNVIMYDGNQDSRKGMRADVLTDGAFNVLVTHYDLIIRDSSTLHKARRRRKLAVAPPRLWGWGLGARRGGGRVSGGCVQVRWNYIIVDEGHRLKNRKSRLSEVLSAHYKSKHRVLLTGTPIQNNLTELWALLNFLLPTIFASADSFNNWFNAPFAGMAQKDVSLNEEEEFLVINRLHQARQRHYWHCHPIPRLDCRGERRAATPARLFCCCRCCGRSCCGARRTKWRRSCRRRCRWC